MSVKITSLPSFPSTKKWQVQALASLRTWIVLKGHSFCSATATLAPWFSVSGGWLLGPWKGKKDDAEIITDVGSGKRNKGVMSLL